MTLRQAQGNRLVVLGAQESGVGAARLAKQRGLDVFVSDMGTIKPAYREELEAHDIAFEEGGHTATRVLEANEIVKSPGIPDSASLVVAAREKGIPVISEIEFAYRYCNGRIVAITGSNGKTTTTLLTHHILHKAGLDVAVGGNVGTSFAGLIADGDNAYYVLELSSFQLDGIVTVVDAKHGNKQLDEHKEAQEQVGFADRLLLSKVDVATPEEQAALRQRLARINPRAPIKPVHFGNADIADVLDIRGFNLNAILEIDPQFLDSDEHEHDEAVQSFVFRSNRPFDPVKLEDFLGGLIQVYGQDMLRYKGVLYMKGSDRQTVFQGVHQMMGADTGKRWQGPEKPSSKMVFIGRNLPRDIFIKGLEQCLA